MAPEAGWVAVCVPEGVSEGGPCLVGAWRAKPGEQVRGRAPLVELTADKVSFELEAPCDGTLMALHHAEGDEVEVGAVLAHVLPEERAGAPSAAAARPSAAQRLSPAVKGLARSHGLDTADLHERLRGSGEGGRITHRDLLRHIESPAASEARSHIVPHSAIRRSTARRMTESLLHTAPHVTTLFEADLGAVLAHREALRAASPGDPVPTLTSYFVLAAVAALQAVPQVNSRWFPDHAEQFDDCNVGVVTALGEAGVLVPVLQRAQELDLMGVAAGLSALVARAREGALTLEDQRGGTFTISNHGVSGSLLATPIIIHQPQSAILGMGKLERRVVAVQRDGEERIEVRPRMYVTLTLDHRMLDAPHANRFMQVLVDALERWPALEVQP